MNERIEEPDFTYWTGDDGILRLKFPAGTTIDLDIATRCIEIGIGIFREEPQPLLVYLDEIRGLSRDVRKLGSTTQPAVPSPTAVGIIVRSPIGRVVGAMFTSLLKGEPYPARVFSSEGPAVEWIRGFR